MKEIRADQIDDLAAGAVLLATGGGGEPYVPLSMAREALTKYGPLSVIQPDELDPEGLVLPMGVIGAPTAVNEKFFNGTEAKEALTFLERHCGRKGVAVMPIEVGGYATMIPLIAAAELGLPLVDADTMRRAFPRAEMTVLTLAGISASPLVCVDAQGNVVLIQAKDNYAAERFARGAAIEMGMSAVCACYPITGAQVQDHTIHGSLTYCYELGRRVRAIAQGVPDALAEMLSFSDGQIIFSGKVIDLERRTENGWAIGTVTLEHATEPERVMRIDMQNENLIAMEAGTALATIPDLISLLDAETGTPMTTDSIGYGQRLMVLVTPAHERWRQPDGIALAGPRAFGYDTDYVPFGGTR